MGVATVVQSAMALQVFATSGNFELQGQLLKEISAAHLNSSI